MQYNLTKFSTVIVNEYYIIDVTYLVSGIFVNFHMLLCKKCDVGYYVINHDVDDCRLVFIVSSSLHKILNECQIKYTKL